MLSSACTSAGSPRRWAAPRGRGSWLSPRLAGSPAARRPQASPGRALGGSVACHQILPKALLWGAPSHNGRPWHKRGREVTRPRTRPFHPASPPAAPAYAAPSPAWTRPVSARHVHPTRPQCGTGHTETPQAPAGSTTLDHGAAQPGASCEAALGKLTHTRACTSRSSSS